MGNHLEKIMHMLVNSWHKTMAVIIIHALITE